MARSFDDRHFCLHRENGEIGLVETSGSVRVTDATGDSAGQAFEHRHAWTEIPVTVRQQIRDAWDAYHAWLEQRRAARDV